MELSLGKNGKQSQKLSRRNMPVKRSINLAGAGVKKTNWAVFLPVLLLVVAGALALGKFGVLDRLEEVNAAQGRVARVQQELDDGYRLVNSYGELTEQYAHYTYSGMTDAELRRTDRVKVLELLDRVVLPQIFVQGWQLRENELTLFVTGNSLQDVNLLGQRLEQEDLVDYCVVSTAETNQQELNGGVSAQVTVRLHDAEEVYW